MAMGAKIDLSFSHSGITILHACPFPSISSFPRLSQIANRVSGRLICFGYLTEVLTLIELPGPFHKPTFNPKWRKPTSAKMIKAWPPVGATGHIVVTEGDFAKIAKDAKRGHVWDIIIFNFQTEDPREVNWYLHHALGCWMSKDNMNFSFEAARTADGNFGKIYLPPEDWLPPSHFKRGSGFGGNVDHQADSAVRILNRLSGLMPGIYHRATHLPPWAYRIVADLIKQRAVTIEIDPSVEMFGAEYVACKKRIYVGSAVMHSRSMCYGVMANEATHVFNHYQSNSTNVYHEELASSLADSIAVACIDNDKTLELLRHKDGEGLNSKLYFAGWVWINHLRSLQNVMIEDFDRYFDHPITGKSQNPKDDLMEYLKYTGYITKQRQSNFAEWDPRKEEKCLFEE